MTNNDTTTTADILAESGEFHTLLEVIEMHDGDIEAAIDYLIEEATTSHELPNADTTQNRDGLRSAMMHAQLAWG